MKTLIAIGLLLFASISSAQIIQLWPGTGAAPTNQEIDQWYSATFDYCSAEANGFDEAFVACMRPQIVGARYYSYEVMLQWQQLDEACNNTWLQFFIPECYITENMVEMWAGATSYIFTQYAEDWCTLPCWPE